MRFAFKTAPQNTTWADMLAVWREADDIDLFESGWTFDHFYPIFSDSTGPCLEGWVTLTALAQATNRLRLGTLVTGVVYRHPAVLANETTDHTGQHYRLTAARCEPKPVQRPHPPICIGGLGEQRTLRTVARLAQHWNLPMAAGPEAFKEKRDVLAAHCADIGRDPAEITTSIHIRLPQSGDIGPLVDEAAAYADAGMDLGIVYLPPPHTPAVLEPVAQALRPLAG